MSILGKLNIATITTVSSVSMFLKVGGVGVVGILIYLRMAKIDHLKPYLATTCFIVSNMRLITFSKSCKSCSK